MKKLISLLLILFVSASCTKKIYVPVETRSVSTDTVERFVTLRERLATVDSVTTESRGDTVFRTIVRERWRNLALADSSRRLRTDTVRLTRTVMVEKPVAKRRSGSLVVTGLIVVALALVATCLLRLWRKAR